MGIARMDKTTKRCSKPNRDCRSVKSDNESIEITATCDVKLELIQCIKLG